MDLDLHPRIDGLDLMVARSFFSKTLNEDPTRMFSTCLVGFCGEGLPPNWSCRWVFWTGLVGGVGVKEGGLVGSAGL